MALVVFALVLAFLPIANSLKEGNPGDIPASDWISREEYCHGCEYTMKALDRLIESERLSEERAELDERVINALGDVCSEEQFQGSSDPKKMVEACTFMRDQNMQMLKALMIAHYSRKTDGSYLDLSHQVCMSLTKACLDVPGEKRFPEHLDSDLEFDRDDNTFRVKPGRNIRVPQPMRSKDDL